MPGQFNLPANEDGGDASTGAADKVGFYAHNDNLSGTVQPGSAQGAGLLGVTLVPRSMGVLGANNSDGLGTGVQGNGNTCGVSGYSNPSQDLIDQGQNLPESIGIGVRGYGAIIGVNGEGGRLGVDAEGAVIGVQGRGLNSDGVGVQGYGDVGIQGEGRVGVVGHASRIGVQGDGSVIGVQGSSYEGDGIIGTTQSNTHNAIFGYNLSPTRVPEGSNVPVGNGVYGYTLVPNASGICGAIDASNTDGAGVTGIGRVAGRFYGDVFTTGNVRIDGGLNVSGQAVYPNGGDLAENFATVETGIAPGTVMTIYDEDDLRPCIRAYDKAVIGVISGAGSYQPGIIFGGNGQPDAQVPIALTGKVFCKVDASFAPIHVGDLLTTSTTPGHAMHADPKQASGAIIGKALRALEKGQGMIPILITLQ